MNDAATAATVRLDDGVRRLLAPNAGMMTGAGTNTYLIGRAAVAVIDPGPPIDRHVDAILEQAGATIRWILVTHTHPDHSPAAALLAERTGAEVIGRPAPAGRNQDRTFVPTRVPVDGDVLETDEFSLGIVHTPGHASNHLCFLLRDRGWLFTGDHVINGSTVVIDPPDGDMHAYIESLRRLRELPVRRIAGGHGAPLDAPVEAIEGLIAHRLKREAKVLDCLRAYSGTTPGELVRRVYDEVDSRLHGIAQRSLLAHLLKLERDGAASRQGDRWFPA